MKKTRFETVCDGVFAIVMTLLILDVRFPEALHGSANFSLWYDLFVIKDKIFAFAFSFLIIASYVIGHHFILSLASKIDGVFLTLNFLYLMIITFIPFPTSVLADHLNDYATLVFYAVNVLLAGIFHTLMLWHLYRKDHLRDERISKTVAQTYFKRNLWGTSVVLAAIGSGYFSIPIALFILVGLPVYFNVTRILTEERKNKLS